MKPWREIAVPHQDVLEGSFQQSEFAADITAVHTGKAPREYQDAIAFFERTFITEGMGILLVQVVLRLSGKGGEPVIQLQTFFGGGKTHTELAVYHLATRTCALSDLPGIAALIDRAGLLEVPRARVAVLDGTAHAPGQPWKRGKQVIRTLWGELAWQLGGEDAFALGAEADATGTSPGKDVLRDLLELHAPCVVLIDELVAYVRQFAEGKPLSGGTYDSNLSFIQALTEAVKLVPTAIVLASLPESEVEAGSQRGVGALRALEKNFGRVQALWKPVATEEAFEIVRRRLFEPVRDPKARETVCRAFADTYVAESARLPGETQEGRYYDRLVQAYPIHPKVFDRMQNLSESANIPFRCPGDWRPATTAGGSNELVGLVGSPYWRSGLHPGGRGHHRRHPVGHRPGRAAAVSEGAARPRSRPSKLASTTAAPVSTA